MRNFTLYNSSDEPIATYSKFLGVGTHVIPLDFDVPAGTGYSIGCDENDLFRNNNAPPFFICNY